MKQFTILLTAFMLSACAAIQSPLEAPNVTLTDLRILEMTLLEQRYALTIRVQNPNPVVIPVTGMSFQLDINESELGRGVSDKAVTIPAYGEAQMEIHLVSNIARILSQFRGLESGKGQNLRYRLSGGISVSDRLGKLPFDYKGVIGETR